MNGIRSVILLHPANERVDMDGYEASDEAVRRYPGCHLAMFESDAKVYGSRRLAKRSRDEWATRYPDAKIIDAAEIGL